MSSNAAKKTIADLPPFPRLTVDLEVKASMTHLVNPRNFALQLGGFSENLDEIIDLCETLPDVRPELASLEVGTLWGALFSEDSTWYRGLIRSLNEENKTANVFFIDYGNSDNVSIETGLRVLPEALLQFPPQIVECQWIQAAMPKAMEKLDRCLDENEEITVTILETKCTSSQIPLTFGNGNPGPVVIGIKELETPKKTFNGPTLGNLPELEAELLAAEVDEGCDSSIGDSIDSVDHAEVSSPAPAPAPAPASAQVKVQAPISRDVAPEASGSTEPTLWTRPLFGMEKIEPEAPVVKRENVQVESPNVFELQLTRIRAELDRQGSLGEKNALECGTYYKFTEKLCVRMDSLSKEIESLKNKDDGALDMIRADLKKLETKMAQMILTSGISKPAPPPVPVPVPEPQIETPEDEIRFLRKKMNTQSNMIEFLLQSAREKEDLLTRNFQAWQEDKDKFKETVDHLMEEIRAYRLGRAGLSLNASSTQTKV